VSLLEFLQRDFIDNSAQFPQLLKAELSALRDLEFQKLIDSKRSLILARIADLLASAPRSVSVNTRSEQISIASPTVSEECLANLRELIQTLIPWRKGPFQLFGEELDAEWRSDLKFARLALNSESLSGKRVADVGCGNGYFMLRLLGFDPELVVGFDPTNRYLLQYLVVRSLIPQKVPLLFEPLRSDCLRFYSGFFDLSLCLGVYYHHPNPTTLLAELFDSLRPGGRLILETIYAPGQESLIFNGEQKYARMKNVYVIPSQPQLEQELRQSGFSELKILHQAELSTLEQRRTPYAPGDSLAEFLDPSDNSRTAEGFVRPHRLIIQAEKL